MQRYTETVRQTCRNDAADLPETMARLGAFLRRRYSMNTAQNVEADTGIPAATVSNWLELKSMPRALHLLRLITAYGPSLLAATYPHAPAWLDDARRAEETRRLEAEAEEIRERLEALRK